MSAQPVFTPRGALRRGLRERLRTSQRIFLFLDYDGTLVPIRKRPGEATLARGTRTLLDALDACPHVRMGIVTGRSLADITALAPAPWTFIAANHGLEIRFGNRLWMHPAAKRAAPRLDAIARELSRSLADISGASVEHKGLTLAVHYRRVRRADAPRVEAIVKEIVGRHQPAMRLGRGKKIWEVKPSIAWTKGDAVVRLLRSMDPSGTGTAVYIGDDTTDEDAFRIMPADAVTVKVGGRQRTHARFHVRTVSEVKKILIRLLDT